MELYEAFHAAMHDGDKGKTHRVAARMGLSYDIVAKWGLRTNGEKRPVKPYADQVVPFMLAAESHLPLEWMATAVGGVVLWLPKAPPETRELAAHVCRAVSEFGEFAAEAGKALADGTMTRREAEGVVRQGTDAQREIEAFKQAAKAAVK